MVGRRNMLLVTKRSLRNADASGKRPKRIIQSKLMEETVGMSRQEEQELNKALYASLQENRRSKSMPSLLGHSDDSNSQVDNNISFDASGGKNSSSVNSGRHLLPSGSKSTKPRIGHRRSLRAGMASPLRHLKRTQKRIRPASASPSHKSSSKLPSSLGIDESSQDSGRSSVSSANGSKRKIHAQRKFAQGCSLPGTPSSTPAKLATPSIKKISSRMPKTEDFLTFLCFRGTSALPPHLDFFNYSREELASQEEGHKSGSSNKDKHQREGTPESSSSSCGANEEVAEAAENVNTPISRPSHGAFTPFKTSSQASGEVTPGSSLSSRHETYSSHCTPSSASRHRQVQSSTARSSEVMSARKSLLGKLTSVAQQHAKKILDRSARQREGRAERMAKRLQLKRKLEEEEEEEDEEEEKHRNKNKQQKKQTTERRDGKKTKGHSKKSSKKEKMCSSKSKDRQSNLHSAGSSRTQHSPQEHGKNVTKVHSESKVKLKDKNRDSEDERKRNVRSKESVDKKNAVQEASQPRRPYKVRPIERVRTRGYNLLLASKQALKRAKRDNSVVFRSKTDLESDNVNDNMSGHRENTSVKGMDNNRDSKRSLDKKVSSTAGFVEKKRNVILTEDNFSLGIIRSGSIASETESVPSRRSSRESWASKPSPARIVRRSSSSSVQTTSEEKSSVPTFHPTDAEFSDPMVYISKIQAVAEPRGMCRIIPPPSWRLDSGKFLEEIRFTSQVQTIHRLFQRWGPSVQQSAAIGHHLMSGQSSGNINIPHMGGVELDLPRLHQLVEDAGGPKKMVDKKDWAKIADLMNIPKQSPDRSDRLYDIYCYHVFPYASLSEKEQKQLDSEVEALHRLQSFEEDPIKKGRSMTLSSFNRIARNVMSMWFKDEPTPQQVENEYWKLVEERKRHITVQCGHINTRAQASGFPTRKDSPLSRHAWNLNNIPSSPGCVLNYLGHVPGVTIPTLHIGMLFSTSCWSSAPHGLPYIQYQHTGAPTIWHCVSKAQEAKMQSTLKDMVPTLVTDKPCWLKEDWLMINPKNLTESGVIVEKCVQYPGQFVVVFPGAFTSTISCGYNVSESVHFALPSWLPQGLEASTMLNNSEERELFSMCSLLCHLVQDEKVEASTVAVALPLLSTLLNKEQDFRNQLKALGLKEEKKEMCSSSPSTSAMANKRGPSSTDEKICDVCNKICYLSMVHVDQGDQTLCIEHGFKHIQKRKNIKSTKLYVWFTQTEMETILRQAEDRLSSVTALEGSNNAGTIASSSSNISINSASRTRHISRLSSSTS